MKPVYWRGSPPVGCEIRQNHSITEAFVDGRTVSGMWAKMCPRCHQAFGMGLGVGRGQKYAKQADGRWLKVEG